MLVKKKPAKIFIWLQILYFYGENFLQLIYRELHKASHQFTEEKSRTKNDKQLFGINSDCRDRKLSKILTRRVGYERAKTQRGGLRGRKEGLRTFF